MVNREAAELFIASYMYCYRYGIHVNMFSDSKLTECKDYGITTQLSDHLRESCSDRSLLKY